MLDGLPSRGTALRTCHSVVLPIAAFVLVASSASLASAEPDPLAERAEAIRALFTAGPQVPEDLFAPTFVAAVPPAKLAATLAVLFAEGGSLDELRVVQREGPNAAKYEGRFSKGLAAPMSLTIEATPPHRIIGFWIGPFMKPAEATSLAVLAPRFGELPGQASFAACKLGDGAPEIVASWEPDRSLALGSTFKLWLLGTLARDAAEGRHRWDEVTRLEPRDRSLPSGKLQNWPSGSPVTLHTLAALMISESDNTATDALLRVLGRERVEETMSRMGVAAAARNRPFLATAESFAMKGVWPKERAAAFAAMDEKGRRKALAAETVPVDLSKFQNWSEPFEIGRLEWFASASDLCRSLDWLRHTAERKGGEPLPGILSINPGLLQHGQFAYHGFKGGSEPGVLSHAHLVRTKGGTWWALTASWNDPAKPLDNGQLHGLLERAFDLIADEPQATK